MKPAFPLLPGLAKHIFFIFLLALFLYLPAFPVPNASSTEIPVHMDFARHGDRVLALASFDIPPDYHSYAHAPGAAGKPTNLDLVIENEGSMPALYPAGSEEADIYDPAVRTRVYSGHVQIVAVLPKHSAGKLYAGTLEMLLCSTRHCMPVKTRFTGNIPEKIPPLSGMSWEGAAIELLNRQGDASGALSLEEGTAPPPRSSIQPEEPGTEKPGGEKHVEGEPIEEEAAYDLDLSPRYADENMEIYSLGSALFMGMLAGLLLNAMPCVLPVLTLKVSGLLLMGQPDDRQKLKIFRTHNLCFAAGILTLFTALALLLGMADLMWGQPYQSQAVLFAMLLLVFLMGISMLGVFTLPAFDLRLGQDTSNPMLKSYLTGLVSTFLATPCSGPLLGGVLAWAFVQPLPILMTVFLSVGFGMSLPYVAFSIWPGLAQLLPRPGAWMHTLERILGFLLLATALYLLSILPRDKHMQILAVLLATSAGAWLWGTFCGLDAPRWRRYCGNACAIVLLACSVFWVSQPAPITPQWQSFSPDTFARDIGRKPMLVEFTADWCPNCKFLEATLLGTDRMRKWQRKYGFELVKVDLTNSNPYAEKLLAQLGSRSIPLTALFPGGKEARTPLVLRDIYGEKLLLDAMKTAFSES